MSIEARCPTCEKSYSLPDAQYGKRVRCKHCADVFLVGGAGAATAGAAPPPIPKAPPPETEKKKKKAEDQPSMMMPLIMIAGGILILVLGIGGVLVWMFLGGGGGLPGFTPINSVDSALAAVKEPDAGRRRTALEWFAKNNAEPSRQDEVAKTVDPLLFDSDQGTRQWAAHALAVWGTKDNTPSLMNAVQKDQGAVNESLRALGFLRDPRALTLVVAQLGTDHGRWDAAFKALQAWGPSAEKEVVKRLNDPNRDVRGNVVKLLAEYKTKDELTTVQSIADLGSPEKDTRWSAADWLSKHAVISAHQAKASKALLGLMNDPDNGLREAAQNALAVWADKNDPQTIELFVGLLDNAFRGDMAYRALVKIGPAAEKGVVKYLHHPNRNIRLNAAKLLKEYKTKDDLLLTQTISDLGSKEKDTLVDALEWLSKHELVAAKQADVCKALAPLLKDLDDKVHDGAIHAVIVWADKDMVPTLVDILNDDVKRFRDKDRIMEALVRLKDERGAAGLATRLEKGGLDRAKVTRALQQMGSVAEKPTLEILNHTDKNVRIEACKILGEVGTKASEEALTKLSQGEKDRGVKTAADAALKKVKARVK